MPTVNDQIVTKLNGLGYTGSINDKLFAYYKFLAAGSPAHLTSCSDFRRFGKLLSDGLASKFPLDVLP